jgi:hypothetical protein
MRFTTNSLGLNSPKAILSVLLPSFNNADKMIGVLTKPDFLSITWARRPDQSLHHHVFNVVADAITVELNPIKVYSV